MDYLKDLWPLIIVAIIAYIFSRPANQEKQVKELRGRIDAANKSAVEARAEVAKEKLRSKAVEDSFRRLADRVSDVLNRASARDHKK